MRILFAAALTGLSAGISIYYAMHSGVVLAAVYGGTAAFCALITVGIVMEGKG